MEGNHQDGLLFNAVAEIMPTALANAWWTLYVRRLLPGCHAEAHVARPLLMTGVGHHGGQRLR